MIANYLTIRKELENWSVEMGKKEELIIFSKADIIDPDQLKEMQKIFEKTTKKKVALTISAGAYIRIDELKDLLISKIPESISVPAPLEQPKNTPTIYDLRNRQSDPKRCQIKKREDGDFDVTGIRMEEIVRMTDTRYIDGVNRVYDVMEKLGVMRKLKLLIADDMARENSGFFEGEEDFEIPNVWISGKKFSLEGLIFMREEK